MLFTYLSTATLESYVVIDGFKKIHIYLKEFLNLRWHFSLMYRLYKRKSQLETSLSLTLSCNTRHVPFVNDRKEAAGSDLPQADISG